ncbi:MAG: UDP-N-acetylmuramate--L-alanine ligase [Planctomycetota bacterium]
MNSETGLPRHIHIVGIGGSATSGLAQLLKAWGHVVSGSDRDASLRSEFESSGIQFFQGHRDSHLPAEVGLVIRSAAVPEENPEVVAAVERNVECLRYSECLGRLTQLRRTIAVAGTHGKTSTTGILTSIFMAAERDPTVILGGELVSIGGNWRKGSGKDFIVESCEFQKSFLDLHPSAGIITNIELDHPEIYEDQSAVEEAFRAFLQRLRHGSPVVIPIDLHDRLVGAGDVKPICFGIGEGPGWRGRIRSGVEQRIIEIHEDGELRFEAHLQIPGLHAVKNTTAAVVLSFALGIDPVAIRQGIENFEGVKRRFEKRPVLEGVEWFEDYAHHPTEVAHTLAGARELYPDRKIWALFQPHQLTRLDAFLEQFGRSFSAADEVIVLPIYSVREDQRNFPNNLREVLQRQLRVEKVQTRLLGFSEAIHDLPELVNPGDVVISLGAGDNDEIGRQISNARDGVLS